jgi:DNA-directed RNA polymerase I subunit RPA43
VERGDGTVLGGRWLHTTTGEPLGGSTGVVEFTVVGMTAAHHMLSLLGSLQPDPFNPAHTHVKGHLSSTQEGDEEEEPGDVEMERGLLGQSDRVCVEMDDADSAVGVDDGDVAMERENEDVPLAETVAQEAEELARREAIRDQERAVKQKQQERKVKRKRKEERKKAKADVGVKAPAVVDTPKAKKRMTKPDAQ